VNGCERSLNTLTDCGNCGVACALPNASESCSGGTCQLAGCDYGYENCDGNTLTGCELQHSGLSNSFPGENLGAFGADTASGFLCPTQCLAPGFDLTRQGRRGRWFTMTAREDSLCSAAVQVTFVLTSPPGANYNLSVNGACSYDPPSGSSSNPAGVQDRVRVWCDETSGDSTFTPSVEVSYDGGNSCALWTLEVFRGGC
jgi:hypothetical protein